MDFDKYKNTKKYPDKEDYTTYKVVTVYNTYEDLNYEEFKKCKDALNQRKIKFLVDETLSDEYQQKQKEYYEENVVVNELFIKDLKDDVGDFNNECLFNLLYAKAYEESHSSGYREIYNKYLDLYDFVEDVLKCVAQK